MNKTDDKKTSYALSVTAAERKRIEEGAARHRFERTEYVLALEELDRRLGFVVVLDPENRKVLELPEPLAMVAEAKGVYEPSRRKPTPLTGRLEAEGKALLEAKARAAAKRPAHT